MRRDLLPAPRALIPDRFAASSSAWVADECPPVETAAEPAGPAPADPPRRDALARPTLARPRRRALFRPRRGWFRRIERYASWYLSREVYPRIPWIHLPYDAQLRCTLSVSEAEIRLAGLPEAFDGLRLLLISDIHAGPFVSPRALAGAFERLLSLEPDVVLLAGDLTSSRLSEFTAARAAFATLDAPLGVFAVLGNHDHYTEDPRRLSAMIEQVGIRVLHNAGHPLERDGRRLWLAGVDDLLFGEPDLDAALSGTEPPVVLLSHNPDLFFEAARRGVALTLSGHTHGGQVRIPGLPVLVRQSRYHLDQGRFRLLDRELVVSRGLGVVGLPWRAACRPEGVLLRLRSGAGQATTGTPA